MIKHYFIGIQIPGREAALFNQMKTVMELQKTHKVPVAPEDMHITLFFLGAVEKDVLTKLIREIGIVAPKHPSFQLTSSSVNLFGNSAKPRVVYVNIEDNQELKNLQKELSDCVAYLSISHDDKPYVPHITLAKKWRNTEPLRPLSKFDTPVEFKVEHFYLYEIQSNKSPKYKPIAIFQLGEA